MRLRSDGLRECGYSELSAAQKREALAMLPVTKVPLKACPTCRGAMKPKIEGGRQSCSQCKRLSYPPPWRNTAGTLYWRVDAEGRVVSFDDGIRF